MLVGIADHASGHAYHDCHADPVVVAGLAVVAAVLLAVVVLVVLLAGFSINDAVWAARTPSTAGSLLKSVLAVAALDRALLRAASPAASEKPPTEGELND
jgi:hypothetical protein